jgi:hypothetical protein
MRAQSCSDLLEPVEFGYQLADATADMARSGGISANHGHEYEENV